MKKLLLTLALSATSLLASAQFQLYNSDFEQWEEVKYTSSKICEEPIRWSSFYDATGSMKSAGTGTTPQIYKDTETRPGSAGQYSVRITSRSVMGIVAQGNFTNGCVNMGSMTATDASGNYNYINEARSDQSMHFTGHPDAVRVWVRFNGAKTGNVSVMLTTKGYYQDPSYQDRNKATLVAHATNGKLVSNDKWTEYIIPFETDNSGLDPYYCLTNVSTCAEPGAGNASDYLYVDDLEMLYYSEATSIVYNGQDVLASGSYNGMYDPSLLEEVVTTGRAATWTSDFDYNSYVLTVNVKGENYSEDQSNVHSYRIQFVKPNADLSGASQDGVDLLQGATGVIYDAAKVQLSYNADVVSHTETFDYKKCQLTVVMTDAAGNEIKRVIQFHVPSPAIESATWNGNPISVDDFETGDPYVEENLVLTPNADATLERSFDERQLVLTVKALAPAGYEAFNRVYTFQFGMGEMLDPSKESVEPVDLVKGNTYYIINKKTGLLLSDNDILGTDLTEWTIGTDNTVMSAAGKYVTIEVIGNSGLFGSKDVKSVNVSTSKTTTSSSTTLSINGDKDGYTFSMTAEWDYGLWSNSSYTAYLGTTGTFLTYAGAAEGDEYKWLLYDVAQYKGRQIRSQIYDELQRAKQLGLNITGYRQTYEKNLSDADALKVLLGTIRQDEADFVEGKYTIDQTEKLGSTKLSDAAEWTTTMVENYGGQHWSGQDLPYYEQSWEQYRDGNWAVAAEKEISLPAGKYVLKATARSSALAEAYMEVNGQHLLFPANGDTGWGVDTSGNVNYSATGTYANDNIGRGWEYRYLQFDLHDAGVAKIKIGGSAEAKNQWLSISDMYLLTQPVPEIAMVSFTYDGQTYTPDASDCIDLSDVYYRSDLKPEVETLGYGDVTCLYDESTWQMTVTVKQESDVNYGLVDRVYVVQFHKADPQLATLLYDGVDILGDTYVDAYYSAGKLTYTGNVDAEDVQVSYDKDGHLLTIVVSGYGISNTYMVQFKDASAVSQSYTEKLLVNINNQHSDLEEVTVTLREYADGTYDFELPNFILNLDGEEMPIGTIIVSGIQMERNAQGTNVFQIRQNINIAAGDLPGYSTDAWYGPWLGEIPVEIVEGSIFEGRMNVRIHIDMRAALDQVIVVKLGEIAVTPVDKVLATGKDSAKRYNLRGQQVDGTTKGVVVKKGKKYNN